MTRNNAASSQVNVEYTHILVEALFSADNAPAMPPELVLEVVESSVSAMVFVVFGVLVLVVGVVGGNLSVGTFYLWYGT